MGLIALDICNTLADINLLLEEALGPVPNPHQYYHPKVNKDFFKENQWVFTKAPVIRGAVEGVRRLTANGKFIYLTARPEWSNAITREWLTRHGFPNAPIIHSTNKAEVAMRLSVSLAIDDAPHEIKSLSKVCTVLVPAQPYNHGLPGRFTWDALNKGLTA